MRTERIPSEDRKDGHLEAKEKPMKKPPLLTAVLGFWLPELWQINFSCLRENKKLELITLQHIKKHLLYKVSASSL